MIKNLIPICSFNYKLIEYILTIYVLTCLSMCVDNEVNLSSNAEQHENQQSCYKTDKSGVFIMVSK